MTSEPMNPSSFSTLTAAPPTSGKSAGLSWLRRSAVGALTLATVWLGSSCASARTVPPSRLQTTSGPWEVEVLVDGAPVQTYQWHGGTYILGQQGDRYTLRINNHSGRRIEAVASIDGRDVVDGKPGNFEKRGYLVPAWGSVDIDGWRLSQEAVAAFRFSAVADSYAARTGSAREVGVIGVAIFPERIVPPRPVYRPTPQISYGGRRYEEQAPIAEGSSANKRGAAPALEDLAPAPAAAPRASSGAMAEDAADKAASRAERRSRPGLGTEFGETVASEIQEVSFVRASQSPAAVLGARYNDRAGLMALGIDVDHRYACGHGADEQELRQTASPFPGETRYAQPPVGWRPSCPVRY